MPYRKSTAALVLVLAPLLLAAATCGGAATGRDGQGRARAADALTLPVPGTATGRDPVHAAVGAMPSALQWAGAQRTPGSAPPAAAASGMAPAPGVLAVLRLDARPQLARVRTCPTTTAARPPPFPA